MATIRIEDPIKPVKSFDERETRGDIGGVYNTRQLSLDRRSSRLRRESIDRSSKVVEEAEAGDEDEDPGLRQAGDFKKKQVCLNLSEVYLLMRILTSSGLQRKGPTLARIPEHRRHLR